MVEDLRDLGPLLLGQLLPADQVHAVLGQPRPQHVGVAARLFLEHRHDSLTHELEEVSLLLRGVTLVTGQPAGSMRSAS